MNNLKKIILIAVIAILFNSCAKDGATGSQGVPGVPGNANVNSYTFTTDSSSWSGFPQTQWEYQYTNLSMNLSGGVEVYFGSILSNSWTILPYTGYYYSISAGVSPNTSTISITYQSTDTHSIVNNPGIQQFEIITIPKQ